MKHPVAPSGRAAAGTGTSFANPWPEPSDLRHASVLSPPFHPDCTLQDRAAGARPARPFASHGFIEARRLTPMLDGDRRRIELAYSLLFALPGTPVIRYGDELGMGDDRRLPERSCARTPMQWSTLPNGGFSSAPRTVLPVISEGPFGFERVNVADQRRDHESRLNWTERIIRMRKECPQIGWGDYAVLDAPREVLALRYDWQNISLLVLHNLSQKLLGAMPAR